MTFMPAKSPARGQALLGAGADVSTSAARVVERLRGPAGRDGYAVVRTCLSLTIAVILRPVMQTIIPARPLNRSGLLHGECTTT